MVIRSRRLSPRPPSCRVGRARAWAAPALLLVALGTVAPPDVAGQASALRSLPGFQTSSLPANDDESAGPVSIGFPVSFFGRVEETLFVNNNGNVTFGEALEEWTPESLVASDRPIIAPFWADVDTSGAGVVTYGRDAIDGRAAFGVSWLDVGYFDAHDDALNRFQLVLIDRSDLAPGEFDIEFNYDRIVWETGDLDGGVGGLGGVSAAVGYSSGLGTAETSFELAGTRQAGAFLDTNLATGLIHGSRGTAQPGRYVFPVRGGCVGGCDDGNPCNGVETCDPARGCLAGVPLDCDDGNDCNGLETCEPASGCVPGIPDVCEATTVRAASVNKARADCVVVDTGEKTFCNATGFAVDEDAPAIGASPRGGRARVTKTRKDKRLARKKREGIRKAKLGVKLNKAGRERLRASPTGCISVDMEVRVRNQRATSILRKRVMVCRPKKRRPRGAGREAVPPGGGPG